MGKHSSPEQGPFYRSFVAWLFPWVLIGVFVLAAVYIAVDVVGKDDTKITPEQRKKLPQITLPHSMCWTRLFK